MMKFILGIAACALISSTVAQATEYVTRIKCTQMLKGGGLVSLTFLDGDWNIANDAVGIVILRDGNKVSIDKANMHFAHENYVYTIDADQNSPILQTIHAGNAITLTGNVKVPNFYQVSGTKNKFECSAPLASARSSDPFAL